MSKGDAIDTHKYLNGVDKVDQVDHTELLPINQSGELTTRRNGLKLQNSELRSNFYSR